MKNTGLIIFISSIYYFAKSNNKILYKKIFGSVFMGILCSIFVHMTAYIPQNMLNISPIFMIICYTQTRFIRNL